MAERTGAVERTFFEQQRAIAGWMIGFLVIGMAITALYPTVRGNPQLATLHEGYPKALRSLCGTSDMTTGPG